MKRFVLLLVMIVSAGILLPGAGYAQDATAPLIVEVEGDLWTWREGETALTQITNWGHNSDARVSPDGKFVVYNSIPQVGLDAVERTGGFSGPMVDNIWLLDLATGDAVRVADQPDPAYFWDDVEEDNVIARSDVSWAPDSSGFAWTDFFFADFAIHLGVYDMATGETVSLDIDLPEQYGVPTPIGVYWLNSGIVIRSWTYNMELGRERIELRVYDRDGRWIGVQPLAERETGLDVTADIFALYQGRDYYATFYADTGEWTLVNVITGAELTTTDMPELYSRGNPEGSLRVALTGLVDFEIQLGGRSTQYFQAQVLDAAGNVLIEPFPFGYPREEGGTNLMLSPNGQALASFAYDPDTRVVSDALTIWRDGATITAPIDPDGFRFRGVQWGQTMWRFPDDASMTAVVLPAAEFSCPDALPTRLAPGDTARVLPGSPNRVRATPSLDGELLGDIAPGETFFIVNGPVCDDGIVWWQFQFGNVIGWTAEGVDAYFVEPVE